jgi:thiol-disulfide isomerase/thioredoxin
VTGTLALAAMLCGGVVAEADVIAWEHSYDAGIAAAKEANKPVLIDFTAEWCVWCRKMDDEVYTDPAVVEALNEFVCIKLDTDRDPRVALAYQVRSLPRTVMLNTFDEVTVDRTGYMPAADFLEAVADGRANAHVALGANAAPEIKPVETPAQTVERMLSDSEGDRDAVLLALLSDPDPEVRRQALELVKASKDASVPLLVKGLSDAYLGTRIASLEALRALGVKPAPFDPWAVRPERERAASEWSRALAISKESAAE